MFILKTGTLAKKALAKVASYPIKLVVGLALSLRLEKYCKRFC